METKVILIADDAVFMRKMIRNTLTAAGFSHFLEATDGQEAIDMYAENGADLVLLDVTMPNKNGLEALHEIIAMNPEAKIVMCSAIGQDSTIMEALRAGACDFIVKPFKKDQLLDLVQCYID